MFSRIRFQMVLVRYSTINLMLSGIKRGSDLWSNPTWTLFICYLTIHVAFWGGWRGGSEFCSNYSIQLDWTVSNESNVIRSSFDLNLMLFFFRFFSHSTLLAWHFWLGWVRLFETHRTGELIEWYLWQMSRLTYRVLLGDSGILPDIGICHFWCFAVPEAPSLEDVDIRESRACFRTFSATSATWTRRSSVSISLNSY